MDWVLVSTIATVFIVSFLGGLTGAIVGSEKKIVHQIEPAYGDSNRESFEGFEDYDQVDGPWMEAEDDKPEQEDIDEKEKRKEQRTFFS